MKNVANKKMFVLYQQLFDEFKKTNENCLLEIEQTSTSQIIINFLHYHDSYKTNNKLLQILEVYPESHERMKNYITSVMRGQILVKKGV
ncbi:hypothetical protein NW943_03620 [Staphylococcus aureus]|uniref:hypothetical protein n=1 Tax=Staphylococcus aureus TaxID=1280 RepID=UPI002200CA9A|nr:hypothetical protein NW943_03620 [Staphylococcus aureus]HDT6305216.1 hypothetical protein [Staphylococcus aureus]HDT6319204.1 hypothetical protein [Staphylococcus aureus]